MISNACWSWVKSRVHEDVPSNKNDVIMCSCPGQACRSISSQTSVQLVGLGLVIRESVDSLCRDGADAQYMQYLSKSRITSPQTR